MACLIHTELCSEICLLLLLSSLSPSRATPPKPAVSIRHLSSLKQRETQRAHRRRRGCVVRARECVNLCAFVLPHPNLLLSRHPPCSSRAAGSGPAGRRPCA
ncbi:hypothetical protein GGR56DRAFT_644655 [Xylariaceae sp. FL0804]|nr:hypothetical protein GGR56DRAFT_644655 [Xylariaceae sp. FL0804]